MEEALVVGLFWFPAERLEPERRLPHVDMSVVSGGDDSEDMHIDRRRIVFIVYVYGKDRQEMWVVTRVERCIR